MKKLVGFDKEIGDGAKAAASVVIDGDQLKALVSVEYPLAKVLEPVNKMVDSLLEKLEKAIPGDWDKPMIEKLKAEAHQELVKLLAE